MKKILTISGWAQKPDSLLLAVPEELRTEAACLDYLPYDSYEAASHLCIAYEETPIVMGWSLGSQFAVRAVAEGKLNPKLLVLFSAPYQYVNGHGITGGTPKIAFRAFSQTFSLFPKKALRNFALTVAGKDSHLNHIFDTMEDDPARLKQWARWLKILGDFSCETLDCAKFPRTLLIHNQPDPVTPCAQSRLFHERLPDSVLEIIHIEGHAPHLQARERVQEMLKLEFDRVAG